MFLVWRYFRYYFRSWTLYCLGKLIMRSLCSTVFVRRTCILALCFPGKVAWSCRFRFVSYNLLADLYADQESSLRDLFPYCPPDIIKSEYRRQLTLREILGYNTDILCVQEMDTKLFNNYYSKQLGRKGYEGLLRQKQGKAHEGVGTFFRRDKFRLIKRHDIDLSTSLFNDAAHSTLAEVINNKAKLKEVLAERTTPLQVELAILVLDLDDKQMICRFLF